jgi:hypothetical protein
MRGRTPGPNAVKYGTFPRLLDAWKKGEHDEIHRALEPLIRTYVERHSREISNPERICADLELAGFEAAFKVLERYTSGNKPATPLVMEVHDRIDRAMGKLIRDLEKQKTAALPQYNEISDAKLVRRAGHLVKHGTFPRLPEAWRKGEYSQICDALGPLVDDYAQRYAARTSDPELHYNRLAEVCFKIIFKVAKRYAMENPPATDIAITIHSGLKRAMEQSLRDRKKTRSSTLLQTDWESAAEPIIPKSVETGNSYNLLQQSPLDPPSPEIACRTWLEAHDRTLKKIENHDDSFTEDKVYQVG